MTTQRCPTGSMITSLGLTQEEDGSMGIANLGCARTDLIAQSGMPPETTYSISGFAPTRTLRCTNGKMGYGVQAGYDDSNIMVGLGLFCRNVTTGEVTDGAGTYEVANATSWGRLWTVDRDDDNKDLGLGAGMDGFVITRNGANAITGLRPLINIGNPGSNLIRNPAVTVQQRPLTQVFQTDGIGQAISEGFNRVSDTFNSDDEPPISKNQSMAIAAVVIGVVALLIAIVLIYLRSRRQ
jgi:hypothetical protein